MSTPENNTPNAPKTPLRRRKALWIGLGVLLVGSVVVAGSAFAGRGPLGCSNLTDEEVKTKVFDRTDRLLDKVDANDEQRADILSIVDAALPDMLTARTEGKQLKADIKAALNEEPIDRAKVELLRQRGIALADKVSKRGLTALMDAAEVLDADQRAELREMIEKRQRRWRRWHK